METSLISNTNFLVAISKKPGNASEAHLHYAKAWVGLRQAERLYFLISSRGRFARTIPATDFDLAGRGRIALQAIAAQRRSEKPRTGIGDPPNNRFV